MFRGLGTTKIWLFPLVWLLVLAITTACTSVQVRPSLGTDIYPHMPILRLRVMRFHKQHIPSMTSTSAHLYGNIYMRMGVARVLAISSNLGLLGEQSSQKWEIPCLGRRLTAMQNLTPLALSLAEKSVTMSRCK